MKPQILEDEIDFLLSTCALPPVLRIRDVFPDPGSDFFPSQILDPGSASMSLSILTQKRLLSSKKYDPGCSSRIRILTFYSSRIRIRNTASLSLFLSVSLRKFS